MGELINNQTFSIFVYISFLMILTLCFYLLYLEYKCRFIIFRYYKYSSKKIRVCKKCGSIHKKENYNNFFEKVFVYNKKCECNKYI